MIAAGAPSSANMRRTMVTVCAMSATIMQALDTTIANVALPYMQGSLATTQDQINWVLTSYIVAAAIMTSPLGPNGSLLLAAAHLAGVDRIFRIGGAQAVAAMAFGTRTIPKVDKIVGPGNIFVATAKRMVFGEVNIDSIAGPSEIFVLVDNSAEPIHVAADMLSQAEHDELAAALCVTASSALAQRIQTAIDGDPLKNLGLFQEQGKHLAVIMKGGKFHKNRLH